MIIWEEILLDVYKVVTNAEPPRHCSTKWLAWLRWTCLLHYTVKHSQSSNNASDHQFVRWISLCALYLNKKDTTRMNISPTIVAITKEIVYLASIRLWFQLQEDVANVTIYCHIWSKETHDLFGLSLLTHEQLAPSVSNNPFTLHQIPP